MDVVIIHNGLGNQMSQYAFYLNKKRISNSARFLFSKKSQRIHNGYELERVFGIKYLHSITNEILFLLFRAVGYKKFRFVTRPVVRALSSLGVSIVSENDNYNFNPEYLIPSKGIKFYVGGWHSEKYFTAIEESIRLSFEFDENSLDADNIEILNSIRRSNSVSVHVRRGDFLNAENYNKFGAVCTLAYFQRAIEKMKSLVTRPHFFFFTNDVNWVNENFSGADMTIVNINRGENSWKDMFLISKCRGHINSNGSFSWWSAWLDDKKESPVIVPRNFMVNKYFEDIYPESWIKLSDY